MRCLRVMIVSVVAGMVLATGWVDAAQKPTLQAAMARLKVPPPWFNATPVQWDTNRPWKEARLEIRRLLQEGGPKAREGMKLTYLYVRKGEIGDGHEYPLYVFMGGEYAWALQEYEKYVQANSGKGITHAYLNLASCYRRFGAYSKALEMLNAAMRDLPAPPWRIARQADVHDRLGDLYAEQGDTAKARQHYQQAIALYPASDQPWGRHLLHRHAAKVQTKLDLMAYRSLASAKLRDGTYSAQSLGYGEASMEVAVTVRAGKIADIRLNHKEKIDQGATRIIPQRIIAQQSLAVDGITGATVTCQAIIDGVFQALKQAGLK